MPTSILGFNVSVFLRFITLATNPTLHYCPCYRFYVRIVCNIDYTLHCYIHYRFYAHNIILPIDSTHTISIIFAIDSTLHLSFLSLLSILRTLLFLLSKLDIIRTLLQYSFSTCKLYNIRIA